MSQTVVYTAWSIASKRSRRDGARVLALLLCLTLLTLFPAGAGHAQTPSPGAGSGVSWQIVHVPGTPHARVTRVLQALDQPSVLYADAGGILLSVNGGRTWRRLTRAGTHLLATSPAVARDRTALGIRGSRLLLTTSNFKHSRSLKVKGLTKPAVAAFSPTFGVDHTLFVAGSRGRRVFVSANGGRSWRASTLPGTVAGVLNILVSPAYAHNHLAFATVALHGNVTGLARSSDGGAHWRLTDAAGPCRPDVVSCMSAFALRPDGALLGAGGIGAMAVSENGGVAWQDSNLGFVHWHYLQRQPYAVYVSTDGMVAMAIAGDGVRVSRDGGGHWQRLAVTPATGVLAPALVRPGIFVLSTGLYAIDGRGQLEVLHIPSAAATALPLETGGMLLPQSTHTNVDGTWGYQFAGAGFWPNEVVQVVTSLPAVPGFAEVFEGSSDASGSFAGVLAVGLISVPAAKTAMVAHLTANSSGTATQTLPHGDTTMRSSDDATALVQGYLLSHPNLAAFGHDPVQNTLLLSPSLYDPPTLHAVREQDVGLTAVAQAKYLAASDLVWEITLGTVANVHDCADTKLDASTQVVEVYVASGAGVPEASAILGLQAYGRCGS